MSEVFDLLIAEKSPNVKFKKEIEEGNVEYKLRLDYKNSFALDKMEIQMNWRFEEGRLITGNKECHYILGILDDGTLGNLSEDELGRSFDILKTIIKKCNGTILFQKKQKIGDSWILFVTLRQFNQNKIPEICVGFVGPSQSGKTTTISHLSFGQQDDCEGRIRSLVHKHDHERTSGLTSSIKNEIIGFKGDEVINYDSGITASWDTIISMSDKIINLIDFPGSYQFARTILFGLSVYNFDALIIFSSDDLSLYDKLMLGIYIDYVQILDIPWIIVKIDDNLVHNNMVPITNIKKDGITPILSFLKNIKKKTDIYPPNINENIFVVSNMISIPDTGIIYSGETCHGILTVDDNVIMTDGNNEFPLKINSIHKKQLSVLSIDQHELGTFSLSNVNSEIKKIGKHVIITKNKLKYVNSVYFMSKGYMQTDNISLYVHNSIINGKIVDKFLLSDTHVKYKISLSKNIVVIPKNKTIAFMKSNDFIVIGMLYYS
jgi:GTPase